MAPWIRQRGLCGLDSALGMPRRLESQFLDAVVETEVALGMIGVLLPEPR